MFEGTKGAHDDAVTHSKPPHVTETALLVAVMRARAAALDDGIPLKATQAGSVRARGGMEGGSTGWC